MSRMDGFRLPVVVGLRGATVLSIVAIGISVITQTWRFEEFGNRTIVELVLCYYLVALLAALPVGLFRPVARRWWMTILLGLWGGCAGFAVIGYAISGPEVLWMLVGVLGVLVGVPGAFLFRALNRGPEKGRVVQPPPLPVPAATAANGATGATGDGGVAFRRYLATHGFSDDDVLGAWRWLVGNTYRLREVTKYGDALLVNEGDQSVHLLQTGSGQLERIAESVTEFERLAADPENAKTWFMTEILDLNEMLAQYADDLVPVPRDGECLSYKHPPCLGGSASDPENLEACPIPVHFSIMGQIHEQTRYAPPGTPVKIDLSKRS